MKATPQTLGVRRNIQWLQSASNREDTTSAPWEPTHSYYKDQTTSLSPSRVMAGNGPKKRDHFRSLLRPSSVCTETQKRAPSSLSGVEATQYEPSLYMRIWRERKKDLSQGGGFPHIIRGRFCQVLPLHSQRDRLPPAMVAAWLTDSTSPKALTSSISCWSSSSTATSTKAAPAPAF